ncbi:ABC transporter ATP-binding protein [Gemmobacter nectariphilus]|uniref:ABC transporter ATP-binding protein n=1 Tax=Gemmobacter nectariphilus TaxID=220343 RepID=UPI0003FAF91D|nr:ABC transporter ATP-binding protein [Gemmobacter nectariphilus]
MFTISGPPLWRGKARILDAFSFALRPGEMLGVVGPNGSGKSTLLHAIAGLSPEAVTITRDGRALGRREIGHLPQAFLVKSSISVLECILLGRREDLGLRIRASLIREAEALLHRLGLERLADRPMSALSGGQQQRVLIAQRLFRAPALLLMDEPTSALDLHHQLSALSALQTYARQAEGAVIVALHDLTLAARYCDRILLVSAGACGQPDAPDAVLTRDVLRQFWQIEPEFLACQQGRLVIIPHEGPRGSEPAKAPAIALG